MLVGVLGMVGVLGKGGTTNCAASSSCTLVCHEIISSEKSLLLLTSVAHLCGTSRAGFVS